MALSVYKMRGATVPLGFVQVSVAGNQVCLAVNVDANNNNAPGTPFPPPGNFPGTQTETSPSFRAFHIQAFKPGNNNNGLVATTGQVYLLAAPSPNGSGNRNDYGAVIAVIASGADYYFPPDGFGDLRFSPYSLFIDVDNNNDGAIVTGYGATP